MKRSRPIKKYRSSKKRSSTFFDKYKLPIVAAAFIIVIAILFSQTEVMDQLTVARFYEGPLSCGSYVVEDMKLTNDVLGCTEDNIITIKGDHITLDCDDHMIQGVDGVWHGIVVYPGSVDTVIQNCNVVLEGKAARSEAGGRVIGSKYALETNEDTTVHDSSFYVSGGRAVEIGQDNTLTRNTIISESEEALVIIGDDNYIIDNHIISGRNSLSMFSLRSSASNNNIEGNTIVATNNAAIYMQSNANSNVFYSNKIYSEKASAINIGECIGNKFYDNIIEATSSSPAYLYDLEKANSWSIEPYDVEPYDDAPVIGVGTQVGGNYWTTHNGDGYSDTCADVDADGFCDEAYTFRAAHINNPDSIDHIDYYPISGESARSRIIFISDYTTEGWFDYKHEVGLAAADKVCQTEADLDGASVPNGKYVALISTSELNAIDRLFEGKFYTNNADGRELIAESIADLFDGSIANNIKYGSWGQLVGNDFRAWTGTDSDGLKLNWNCGDWTDKSEIGYYGDFMNKDGTWLNNDMDSCGYGGRIYCVNVKEDYVGGECTHECDPVSYPICANENEYVLDCYMQTDGCYGEVSTALCSDGCTEGECIIIPPEECPVSIDLQMNEEVYHEGDPFVVTVWIYDSNNDLMPNQEFTISYIEGVNTGSTTYTTNNNGGFTLSGTIGPFVEDITIEYTVSVAGCDASDTETITLQLRSCSDECDAVDYPACNDIEGTLERCTIQEDGCYDLIGDDCEFGCLGDSCAICEDECDSTATTYPLCDGANLELCLYNGDDGCYDVSPITCDNGCENRACIQDDCTNECDLVDYPQCNDGDTATITCELQGDGCYDSITADCVAGCDPVGGVCLVEQEGCIVHTDCPDNFMCVEQLCYTTQCGVSEDCAPGYICTDGLCEREVVITGDCGDGTCDDGESCSSCEADCGACSNSGGGGGSSSGGTPFINIPLNGTCQANVTCTDWVDCADGFQTRTCTDNNECLEDSPYTSKRECNSDEEAEPKLDDSGKFGSFELPEEGDNRFIWFGGLGIAFIGFLLYYFKSYKPKQTA
ncbi:hypothetical protein HN777_02625 [Candidatus Woesearchaeota archaeon]|nr:hypothetical protein [Candidatus Woesearchaeota archaeon]MBT7402658.1 hypothetical protein [Candidatus Woesearchaeota archaeon]